MIDVDITIDVKMACHVIFDTLHKGDKSHQSAISTRWHEANTLGGVEWKTRMWWGLSLEKTS
jgi:hypothetical protein